MTWESDGLYVKVCGLRDERDMEAAAEAGADAVGFVWYRPSPRHLELSEIARLVTRTELRTVLVTADVDSATLVDAASRTGVDAVQPHGAHSVVSIAAARRIGLDIIHPVGAGEEVPPMIGGDLLLVDNPDSELPGGTGRAFEWDLAAVIDRPFLLAGGLGPDSVAKAVRKVRPFGVDASSGLESSPGVKDAGAIRRFVQEAKQA